MKPVYTIQCVLLEWHELPQYAVRYWKKYWEEYRSGWGDDSGFDKIYGNMDLDKVKFKKIAAFSPTSIRAWFVDLDGSEHSFRFSDSEMSKQEDATFINQFNEATIL